ncbi:MAG: hypothetical protein ACM3SS_20260 [Rhodospirillaceae bacterium]
MQRHRHVISMIAAAIACASGPLTAHGQTTTSTTTGSSTTTSSTGTSTTGTSTTGGGTTTGTTSGTSTTTTGATTTTTAVYTPTESETRYLARLQGQYPTLTKTNMESLVHGLRTGSAITLTSTQGTTTSSTTFTPPTRPMGYGNITRSLTLATRELAAAGITNPTPQQLQAALMGGTLTTANGTVQMQGVLQLRSQGMGWGQIAHTIGVQPGMASGKQPTTATSPSTGSGITTAAGTTTATSTGKTGSEPHGRGITTASGASSVSSGKKAGQASTEYHGRGIVTAAGTSVGGGSYGGRGSEYRSSGAIVAANGTIAGQGVVNGGGSGQGSGGAKAHGGKH